MYVTTSDFLENALVSATTVAKNFNADKISELDIYIFLQRNGTIKFASEQKRAFCLDTKEVWQGAKLHVRHFEPAEIEREHGVDIRTSPLWLSVGAEAKPLLGRAEHDYLRFYLDLLLPQSETVLVTAGTRVLELVSGYPV